MADFTINEDGWFLATCSSCSCNVSIGKAISGYVLSICADSVSVYATKAELQEAMEAAGFEYSDPETPIEDEIEDDFES